MEDAKMAVDLGAWALGFNFYAESPRFISLKRAADITSRLPKSVEKVGIFVNASADEVRIRSKLAGFTMVQLHGDENPSVCTRIQTKKIIKAFRPENPEDLELIKAYTSIKYILIDAAVPGEYGGTGRRGNWKLAKKAKEYGKVILAGGLYADNIRLAVEEVNPFAVDVTSGVEARTGVKDPKKMKEFFKMVKKYVL